MITSSRVRSSWCRFYCCIVLGGWTAADGRRAGIHHVGVGGTGVCNLVGLGLGLCAPADLQLGSSIPLKKSTTGSVDGLGEGDLLCQVMGS
jgi:hypothetical protein